jgi:hypothetical protein
MLRVRIGSSGHAVFGKPTAKTNSHRGGAEIRGGAEECVVFFGGVACVELRHAHPQKQLSPRAPPLRVSAFAALAFAVVVDVCPSRLTEIA